MQTEGTGAGGKKGNPKTGGGRAGNSPPDSLVPAPVLAVTANQEFRARVNEYTLARDSFLAVGHLGRGGCVNLIDTR